MLPLETTDASSGVRTYAKQKYHDAHSTTQTLMASSFVSLCVRLFVRPFCHVKHLQLTLTTRSSDNALDLLLPPWVVVFYRHLKRASVEFFKQSHHLSTKQKLVSSKAGCRTEHTRIGYYFLPYMEMHTRVRTNSSCSHTPMNFVKFYVHQIFIQVEIIF